MNVLAIASHPDDIEFGCAGTISRLRRDNHDVFAMVLTKGESGGLASTREHEQMCAAQILGIKKVFWGNFTDTRLQFYDNVISAIEKVLAETTPRFVFVHHGKDTHQDHRHISACAVAASRNIPNVLFYEGPTSYDFQPNVFVDIRDFMETKEESLSCHKSQVLRTNIDGRSILEITKATATFRGTQCRVPYAEAFISLRTFLFA